MTPTTVARLLNSLGAGLGTAAVTCQAVAMVAGPHSLGLKITAVMMTLASGVMLKMSPGIQKAECAKCSTTNGGEAR